MIELSANQKKAVRNEARQVFVTAGAGSGKTQVLIERFRYFLKRDKVPLEQMIALTFTDKAANELKVRLSERIKDIPGIDPMALIDHGQVTTLHGFCRKLIKEYAIEAGVDPQFSILDDEFASFLKREIADQVLEQTFYEAKYASLYEAFPIDRLKQALLKVHAQWKSRVGEPLAQQRPEIWIKTFRHQFLELMGELPAQDCLESAQNWIASHSHFEEASKDSLLSFIPLLQEVISCGGNKRVLKWKTISTQLREVADEFLRALVDHMSSDTLLLFKDLLMSFDKTYQIRKDRRHALDYDDLTQITRMLLENKLLRERIQSDIKFLMIDECQDLNLQQSLLIESLRGDANTFLVGDIRQSIYGFRQADCKQFGRHLGKGDSPDKSVITLDENYRSQPGCIDFVNALFRDELASADFTFGELKAKRSNSRDAACVQILLSSSEKDKKETTQVLRKREAAQIAKRIQTIVASKRPIQYGDITVLFRAMTHVDLYEDALKQLAIPYHVVRGRGFYYKFEIIDLLNALKMLSNPNDNLVLLSVFKSPLVGLCDDTLFFLTKAASSSVYELIMKRDFPKEISDDDKAKLNLYCSWFEALNLEKHRLSISECIEALLRHTHYASFLLAKKDGVRRYANTQKLIEKARQFEQTMGSELVGFIHYVKELTHHEEEESEAATETEGGNAVRLMTIHAAKGLEFPVVVIAGMDHRTQSLRDQSDFVLDDDMNLLGGVLDPITGKFLKGKNYLNADAIKKEKDREEYFRLLYVAMTRAQELLICSGIWQDQKQLKDKKNSTWIEWVMDYVSFNDMSIQVYRVESDSSADQNTEGQTSLFQTAGSLQDLKTEQDTDGTAEIMKNMQSRLYPECREYHQTFFFTVSQVIDNSSSGTQAPLDSTPGEKTRASSAEFGNVFHKTLQHLSFNNSSSNQIHQAVQMHAGHLDAPVQEKLFCSVQAFLNHPATQDIKSASQKKSCFFKELPFLYRLRGTEKDLGFLVGQVDLLYKSKKGWVLIDYKTGRAEHTDHGLQVLIYAFCLERLLNEKIERPCLYYSETASYVDVQRDQMKPKEIEALLKSRFVQMRDQIINDTIIPV